MVTFNLVAFDWRNRNVVAGNAALLPAAMLWAPRIIHSCPLAPDDNGADQVLE